VHHVHFELLFVQTTRTLLAQHARMGKHLNAATVWPVLRSRLGGPVSALCVCACCTVPRQAFISRARVDSFSLTADMMYVASNAPRIARALFEIVARRKESAASDLLLEVCKVRMHCSLAQPATESAASMFET
jgi:hypothetical protein